MLKGHDLMILKYLNLLIWWQSPSRDEDEDPNAEGANYQLEMMRCLREINVDNNTVGWCIKNPPLLPPPFIFALLKNSRFPSLKMSLPPCLVPERCCCTRFASTAESIGGCNVCLHVWWDGGGGEPDKDG